MKLCKDCKWCEIESFDSIKEHICTHPYIVDPVTGYKFTRACGYMRSDQLSQVVYSKCGFEGKLWEAKE